MRALVILLMALSASLTLFAGPSAALSYHPWCAQYQYRSYAFVCAFDTQAQCLDDVRGVGGFCAPNPDAPRAGLVRPFGASLDGKGHHTRRHHDPAHH